MFPLNVYQRFFRFLRRPDQGSHRRMDAKFKVSTFFALMLLQIVFAGIWIVCYTLLTKNSVFNASLDLNFLDFVVIILVVVFVLPFVEELLFRLPLTYNRNYLLRYVVFLVGSYGSIGTKERFEQTVQRLWRRYFWVFMYALCLFFAFIHLFNHSDYKHLFLWTPILTSIQLLLGLIVSFLRIRFGFLWGWYFHGLYNLLVFTALITYVELHPMQKPVETIHSIDWASAFAEKEVDYEITKKNFTSYRDDCSAYTLTIIEGTETKGVLTSYGVTPNHIFFDRSSAEHILRILSYDGIKVYDPDSLSLTVDLQMKAPQTSSGNARRILEGAMFKALAIKSK